MTVELTCQFTNGYSYTTDKCINFRFVKERYTPYTYLEGSWHSKSFINGEISALTFKIDGVTVHYGYSCGCEFVQKDGRAVLKVKSRGYSDALSKNKPVSGLVTQVDLYTLGTSSTVCYGVNFQMGTPVVDYVNYYDGTSIWDAIVCYSVRASGLHPYISGTNTVNIYRPASPKVLSVNEYKLTERGIGSDYTNLITSISQSDVDGTPNAFYAVASDVSSRQITRHKDIPFDREWIMDSGIGMLARLNYAKRGYRYDYFKFKDYFNVDIMDMLAISSANYLCEISKITVTGGSEKPPMTEILCYHDGYTP